MSLSRKKFFALNNQNSFLLFSEMVTGPTFTSLTDMATRLRLPAAGDGNYDCPLIAGSVAVGTIGEKLGMILFLLMARVTGEVGLTKS